MILFYILILSLPLVSHPLFGRPVAGITIEKWLGGACLLYAFFYLFARRRVPRFLGTGQARAFLLFYVLAAVSYLALGARNAEENMIVVYTSHLLFLGTTLVLIDSLQRLRWALLAAVGSIGWAALYVLRDWQLGSNLYGLDYRPGYVTGDANFFTASALLCVPLAYRFVTENPNNWERLCCLACLVVTMLAIMVAASRGGFLGLVAACLLLAARSRRRLRSFVSIGLLVGAAIIISPASPIHRMLNPRHADTQATDNRLILWQAGLRMVEEHPITGVGLGNYEKGILAYGPPEGIEFRVAHNIYLEVAAEMGIPGLIAFLAIVFFTFRSLHRVRRRAKEGGPAFIYQTCGALQAGLLGFAVAGFFISAQFLKLFWFMVFISACLPQLLEDAREAGERAVERVSSMAAGHDGGSAEVISDPGGIVG